MRQTALKALDRARGPARAEARRRTTSWPTMPAARPRPTTIRSAPARWASTRMAVVSPDLKVRGIEGLARLRRLGHAARAVVQHQRADHHGRRKGRRPDPRPRAAAAGGIFGKPGRGLDRVRISDSRAIDPVRVKYPWRRNRRQACRGPGRKRPGQSAIPAVVTGPRQTWRVPWLSRPPLRE